jgi:ubiquinone/menaquinone biosynthesis C-methylase UbiE
MEGWTCVDIRCGPGGITDFLSPPVGSTGRVVGLDMDHELLECARRRRRLKVVTPFRHLSGDSYTNRSLRAGHHHGI